MKIKLIFSVLLFTCFTVACDKEDDSDSPSSTNGGNNNQSGDVTFDGKAVTFIDGLLWDDGQSFYTNHTEYHFFMSTDTSHYIASSGGNYDYSDGILEDKTFFELHLSSPGSSFSTDTFRYVSSDSLSANINTPDYLENESYFSYNELWVYDASNVDHNYDVIGGQVIVTGTSPENYKLEWQLQLRKQFDSTSTYNLVGKYTSGFELQN